LRTQAGQIIADGFSPGTTDAIVWLRCGNNQQDPIVVVSAFDLRRVANLYESNEKQLVEHKDINLVESRFISLLTTAGV
jgi:hypothetical protein